MTALIAMHRGRMNDDDDAAALREALSKTTTALATHSDSPIGPEISEVRTRVRRAALKLYSDLDLTADPEVPRTGIASSLNLVAPSDESAPGFEASVREMLTGVLAGMERATEAAAQQGQSIEAALGLEPLPVPG